MGFQRGMKLSSVHAIIGRGKLCPRNPSSNAQKRLLMEVLHVMLLGQEGLDLD